MLILYAWLWKKRLRKKKILDYKSAFIIGKEPVYLSSCLMISISSGRKRRGVILSAKINKWRDLQNYNTSQMRFSLLLITGVLFLIPPCSRSDCRRDDGGRRIGLAHCIVRRKWSSSLPVVSLHLPSLPLINMQQQIAAHLVTGKWYSAGKCLGGNGRVWDPAQQGSCHR